MHFMKLITNTRFLCYSALYNKKGIVKNRCVMFYNCLQSFKKTMPDNKVIINDNIYIIMHYIRML